MGSQRTNYIYEAKISNKEDKTKTIDKSKGERMKTKETWLRGSLINEENNTNIWGKKLTIQVKNLQLEVLTIKYMLLVFIGLTARTKHYQRIFKTN